MASRGDSSGAEAMDDDLVIAVDGVSKKFCKSLRRSMLYGLEDVSRNALGMRSRGSTLRKDEFWAVDDVSLELKRGETVGLIGPNGSGKTTLLKMINGIFWPDQGEIRVRGRVGALIAVGAGFHPLLTGRENIYVNAAILGMSRREVDERFDDIVEFAAIGGFLDTAVKHYSSGMFVRLGFAVAVHSDPDIMLVDEVLAVGDRGFQTKCFKRMGELRDGGTSFVIVSHNMHTVAGFVDWVAVLDQGKLQRHDDVFAGIKAYSRMFLGAEGAAVEKLVQGGEHITFSDVRLSDTEMTPGDTFRLNLPYQSAKRYDDVEVDVAVYDAREHGLYHQATNLAYGEQVDLPVGSHELEIAIGDLQLNGTLGRIVVAIWSKGRAEQLFWWRVAVEFDSAPHATGKNLVPITFEVRARDGD